MNKRLRALGEHLRDSGLSREFVSYTRAKGGLSRRRCRGHSAKRAGCRDTKYPAGWCFLEQTVEMALTGWVRLDTQPPSSNRLEIPACDDAPSNKFNLHAQTKGRASGFLVRSDVLPDPAASQSRSASLPQHMHTLDTCHTGPSILAAAAPKAANTRRNNSNSTDTRSGTAWHAVLLSEHDRIYSSRSQSRLWNLMEAG